MSTELRSVRAVCFGSFELNVRERELRKCGQRLKLDGRAFQALELLVERAGELVTRKELQERLWPDSFVEFDRNINTTINRLRKALEDTIESPRYIETRFRLGYRFVAPVKPADVTPPSVLWAVPFDAKPPGKPVPICSSTQRSSPTVPFGTAAHPGLNGDPLRFQLQWPSGELAEVSLRLTTTKKGALHLRIDFSGVGSEQARKVSSRRGVGSEFALRPGA
jgi:DNA-binding winged helix-turn-helix (wHTH) protein